MVERMMAYVWQDTDAPEEENKFGEHWTNFETLEEAESDTIKYIRAALGRQKHKFDEGRVIVHKLWDVSDYARARNLFYQHAKSDDAIRPVIGSRVGRTEVHRIEAAELIIRVNRELIRLGQPLPVAGLSTYQHQMAAEVLTAFDEGHRVILAELCARFGKTLWSGAVAVESGARLIVVASYVKTVFASFAKDLTSYEQWRDVVHVDTQAEGWQEEAQAALDDGRQVVAYLSMCVGSRRQERVDWLFNQPVSRMLIVDEADFGVHQKGQTEPLLRAVSGDDRVLLMTGTNSDRAASLWKVDRMVSVTYPELLVQKARTLAAMAA